MSDSTSELPPSDSEQTNDSTSDINQSPSQSGSSSDHARSSARYRRLRVWPAILLLVALWALRIAAGLASENTLPVMMVGFMGPLVCAGLLVLWWLFLSRAAWRERLAGLFGLAVILGVTTLLADKSVRGFGTLIYAVPWGISAYTLVLICSANILAFGRTWLALLLALVAFGYWDLVRTDEIWANFRTSRSWRWQPTSEDKFLKSLAMQASQASSAAEDQQPLAEADWPAFRGASRDGVQHGVVLAEDWSVQPLREVWRIPIGPGWASFSVAGDRLFTQEQRGEFEAVICYDARSGVQLWSHQDRSRFWEVVGGAGPRATPTLSDGMLLAMGAAGVFHRLDPLSGDEVWQRDINEDAGRSPPQWGYASSPLVAHGVAIVHAGGPGDKGVLAYDIETGDLRWSSPAGDHSYSSPQLSEVCGRSCVLMLTNHGLTFIDPVDGSMLGRHDWVFEGYRVVQPLVVDGSSVLLGTAMGTGTQRIDVRMENGQLTAREAWTSRRMNPYFNDYVSHEGYLYGFDNNFFACVDLATGQRRWKQGRYGNGQVLLLPEGNQLLVISEDGELVLLRASPESHMELARQQVLAGRTWNHPVLVGDRLYVRNATEAACFEMPLVSPVQDEEVAFRATR